MVIAAGCTLRRAVAQSPLSMEDLELLKQTVLLQGKMKYLRAVAGEVLQDKLRQFWICGHYAVGSHSHLTLFQRHRLSTGDYLTVGSQTLRSMDSRHL